MRKNVGTGNNIRPKKLSDTFIQKCIQKGKQNSHSIITVALKNVFKKSIHNTFKITKILKATKIILCLFLSKRQPKEKELGEMLVL